MKYGKLFEDFRKLNPWEVVFTPEVKRVLTALATEDEIPEGKSNRLVLEITEKAFEVLTTFPPNDSFFTDPRPSLQDLTVWLVVTLPHKKVLIKAEYRLEERRCWVTEFGIKEGA